MSIQEIPLKHLQHSRSNVRRVKCGPELMEQLRASIASHGIIQNLTVWPNKKEGGKFLVVAGSRRLEALKSLKKEGTIDDDFPVKCEVLDPELHSPDEISLVENLQRVGLHPVDQLRAFAKLYAKGKGLTVEQIAGRFGYTPQWVERTLRLAMVHPDILKLYEEEVLSQETVMAFTLIEDQEKQLKAYQAVKKGTYGEPTAHEIRRHLTDDKANIGSRLVKYVSLEKYEKAGGTVTRDLFADQDERGAWVDDVPLLRELALTQLDKYATRLKKKGWKWVSVVLDDAHEDLRHYDRFTYDDYDEEGNEIGPPDWTKEQMALSGVLVTVDYGGQIDREEGLIRAEDIDDVKAMLAAEAQAKEEAAASAETEGETGDDEQAPSGDPSGVQTPALELTNKPTAQSSSYRDPEKEALKKVGYSMSLADDLKLIRGNLARWTLSQFPDVALDLLIYQMARSLFSSWGADTDTKPLDATFKSVRQIPVGHKEGADFDRNDPGGMLFAPLEKSLKEKHGDWIGANDRDTEPEERWRLFKELEQSEKMSLLAACVAMMFDNQLGCEYERGKAIETELVIEQIDPPFAQFRPTAETFWARLSKGEMVRILTQELGMDGGHAKTLKKGDLADYMERLFADPSAAEFGLQEGTIELIHAWIPLGFMAEL